MKPDKLTMVLVGAVVNETIYDKAAKVCKEHGNDLGKVIEAFIEGIANGDITISETVLGVNDNDK